MRPYILQYLNSSIYTKQLDVNYTSRYDHPRGWSDYLLNDSLIYSYRQTEYTRENFIDRMHSHDFFELIIYISGDIQYINENQVFSPSYGDVVVTAPGRMHAARLVRGSVYERFVIQFTPDAFYGFDSENDLVSFTKDNPDCCFVPLESGAKDTLLELLRKIQNTLSIDTKNSKILAFSYVIQIFNILSESSGYVQKSEERMPKNIHKIKQYIDENFLEITSATEVANNFYYSREYVSRLFKHYFNTTISEYIAKRKINESKKILLAGGSVTDACYNSGFRNMSSYIKTFSSNTGVTPSKYKKNASEH